MIRLGQTYRPHQNTNKWSTNRKSAPKDQMNNSAENVKFATATSKNHKYSAQINVVTSSWQQVGLQ